MAKKISLRSWDPTPQPSYNFEFITKLTDLGVPDKKKSLTAAYFNIGVRTGGAESIDTGATFIMWVRYSTSEDWIAVGMIASNVSFPVEGTKHVKLQVTGVRPFLHLQVKIEASWIKGDLYINDLGIEYRTHGSSTVQTHDED